MFRVPQNIQAPPNAVPTRNTTEGEMEWIFFFNQNSPKKVLLLKYSTLPVTLVTSVEFWNFPNFLSQNNKPQGK